MRGPDVALHIEELVVHGLAPADRHRFGEALRGELARLFAERGVPPSLVRSAAVTAMDAGAFEVAPASDAAAVGARAAVEVYERLAR